MAYSIICDVCDKTFTRKQWKKDPGIELTVPDIMLHLDTEGKETYTFCSWDCLLTVVEAQSEVDAAPDFSFDEEPEVDEDDEPVQEEIAVVVPHKLRKVAVPATPVPPTGVYFPQGMKVDGRER